MLRFSVAESDAGQLHRDIISQMLQILHHPLPGKVNVVLGGQL